MTADRQPQNRGRILVVDDQESICQLLQEWLTLEGYCVHQARNFDEMRGALEDEPFDLVTLDIAMPGTDGLEILWWINEHHPDVGVLMATALGGLHTVIEAMQLGAWDYLLKPFDMGQVLLRVERAMLRRRLLASKQKEGSRTFQTQEKRGRELLENAFA